MLLTQRNGIVRALARFALGVCLVQALLIVPLHRHGVLLPGEDASAAAGLRVAPKWDYGDSCTICPICTSLAHFLPGAVFQAETAIASAQPSVLGQSDPAYCFVGRAAFPRGPPLTSLAS